MRSLAGQHQDARAALDAPGFRELPPAERLKRINTYFDALCAGILDTQHTIAGHLRARKAVEESIVSTKTFDDYDDPFSD